MNQPHTETDNYYFDPNGLMVFKEKYHLDRGYCCKSGCRHCPFGFDKEKTSLQNKSTEADSDYSNAKNV